MMKHAHGLRLADEFAAIVAPAVVACGVTGAVRRQAQTLTGVAMLAVPRIYTGPFGDGPPVNMLDDRLEDLRRVGTIDFEDEEFWSTEASGYRGASRCVRYGGQRIILSDVMDASALAAAQFLTTGTDSWTASALAHAAVVGVRTADLVSEYRFVVNGVERRLMTEHAVFDALGLQYQLPRQRTTRVIVAPDAT